MAQYSKLGTIGTLTDYLTSIPAASVTVTQFGAKGDGVTDDTAAIQAAIEFVKNAGRGEIFFPTGTYIVSSPIVFYSNMIIRGNGREVTKIYAKNYSATTGGSFPGYMFTASPINDADYVTFKDFSLRGPGLNGSTGQGIYIATTGNNRHNTFENIFLDEFPGNGIRIDTPILTNFKNVRVRYCAGYGFYMNGGTSSCFDNCFATTCLQAGFRFVGHTYAYISGGGSENNGVAYRLESSSNMTLISTGCEGIKYRSAGFPGIGYWFSDGKNNSIISSYATRFSEDPDAGPAENTFLRFDNESQDTVIGFRGYIPSGAGATSYKANTNYRMNNSSVSFINVTFPYSTAGGAPGPAKYLSVGLPEPVVKRPEVRQCVLSGPKFIPSGRPSFLPSSCTSLTLTTSGITSSNPLIVTAANGWYANDNDNSFGTNGGARDLTGFSTNDLTWTLPTNTLSFLYVTVGVDGSLTPGNTSLAPIYQFYGNSASSTERTLDQSVFNIQDMSMKVGTGTSTIQSYRVFVGEASSNDSMIIAANSYAYMGRFSGTSANIAGGNSYPIDHNLGLIPYQADISLINEVPELGYSKGDITKPIDGLQGPAVNRLTIRSRAAANINVVSFISGTSPITFGNWRIRVVLNRGW